MPGRLVFMNVKAAVEYINRLGLLQDMQLAHYQSVIDLLRAGKAWHYLHPSLEITLRAVVVHGQLVRSARRESEQPPLKR